MKISARKRHSKMVGDLWRTRPLLRAVQSAVKPGDVVIDIGTGTGILAIAAAGAGAKHVWAVDCDTQAIEETRRAAQKAGVLDKISFIEGLSFDLDVFEKADVILCETVGSFVFDENILATILDAKRRLLKKGGKIVPQKLELWGAPIGRMPKVEYPAETAKIKCRDIMGPPSRLAFVDFGKNFSDSIHAENNFKITRNGVIKAFAVWPRVIWRGKEITDASPLLAATHWLQGILPIEERRVKSGEKVCFEFIVKPHPEDPKMMTERLWRWRD